MELHKIEITYQRASSIDELSNDDAYLLAKAREVANNAWAPYSGFLVGAVVELSNGKIVTGNNQENAAYPSGLCAERVALFAANANYPQSKVKTIAISAFNSKGQVEGPVKPCGSCRQAILEAELRFEHPIRLLLDGKNGINIIDGITNLLPLSFGKDDL
ncbi:cytidine deaminase [Roseimarinus sediminis]|jgi:cytidine deaminase|uniref:cytidine deaminase n=1 Tax=Roseimarinus sediminis TaxID=1610899 RepID=UPI003D239C6C